MADPTPDFLRTIRVLIEHDVDFIIVGGVCAVLQGVPVTTADLNIVHRRSEENVTKLPQLSMRLLRSRGSTREG